MKTSWFLLNVGEVDQFLHFDALPVGCIILKQGIITYVNSFFAKQVGLAKNKLEGENITDFLISNKKNDKSQANFLKEIAERKQGSLNNLRLQLKDKNGNTKYVAVSISSFDKEKKDKKQKGSGNKSQVGDCLLTVTTLEGLDHEDTNNLIQEDNIFSTLETVIENSSHGIVAYDKDLTIKFFNENASIIYEDGSDKKLKVESKLSEYLDKEMLEERTQELYKEVFSGKTVIKDYVLKEGTLFLRISFKPIVDANDQVVGLIETIEDRTVEVIQNEEIQNRELMLSSFLKIADSYFLYFSLGHELIYFNAEAELIHKQVLGVELKKGMTLQDIYGKEGYEQRKLEYYNTVLEKGEVSRRLEYTDKKNLRRYVDVTYKAMRDPSGKTIGILEFGKDITELIQTDLSRKSSETTLELVLNNSKDSYVAFDLDFNVLFFNVEAKKRYKRIVNQELEIGKHISEILKRTEGYEERLELYRDVIKTKGSAFREVRYEVNGELYCFQNRLTCLWGEDGKVIGLLSCATDITDLILSQMELSARNSTLKAVLDSTIDGIAAIDTNFNVIACNEQAVFEFEKYVDIDLLSGKSIKEQISSEDLERWKNSIYDKVFLGEKVEMTVYRDIAQETYNNVYTPVRDSGGKIIGALEISRNITEIENRRSDLERSEQRYKGLVEHIPTGLAKISQDGRISFASKRGAEILGYTQSELVGKYLINLLVESDKASLRTDMQHLLSGEVKQKFSSHSYVHKNGTTRILEGIASINKTIDNELTFLLAFNDITERHETQIKLDETASNFVSLFMNMHDAVIIYNHKNERYINCNEAGLTLFSRTKEELLKGSRIDFVAEYSSLIPGVNLHKRMEENRNVTAGGKKIENSRTVLIDGEGKERLVNLNIVPKSDDEVYLIMQDITDSMRTELLLKEKTFVYETLIRNSFDGIDILKYNASDGYFKEGELIMRNEIMSNMLGGSEDLFDSEDSLQAISPEIQPDGRKSVDVAREIIVSTMKEGNSLVEYRFEHEAGSYDVVASQKMVEIDEFVYLIKNYRDITDAVKQRKIIKEQIEALNAKNEEMKIYIESNLQLENFAYIASHDLKAPIRSVISFAQLLKNNAYEQLGPKNGRFLDIILTASTNMQVLIDDLLAYSRINTQEIEFENVDMPKLLKHLLIEINQSIVEKNGEVIIKNIPATLVGDASRLRQIFQNLVTNGMKFFKEGETPRVVIDSVENRDHFEFTVKDFGIGIEKQYAREIFLMFKKLHSENKYKGTGIGLSICKKIVEQHEGKIWVESILGKGSTFHFTICKDLKKNV